MQQIPVRMTEASLHPHVFRRGEIASCFFGVTVS
jgi:hypothetical protein